MGVGSIAALTGLMITPLAHAPGFLQSERPWFSYEARGSVLELVRAQKIEGGSCKAWTDALTAVPAGWKPAGSSGSFSWDGDDLKAVTGCDGFPCKVKLDRAEVEQMKGIPEEKRLERFRELLARREQSYAKTQKRQECEIPGEPFDPWKSLEDEGFKPPLQRPAEPSLYERELDLAPGKMLGLHQALDRRAAAAPSGTEAAVWVRDVYTDHYFDRWGEWELVNCDAAGKEMVVIQVLISDMDLLKNTGFFAHALFSKYRKAFEDEGTAYLDARFEKLKESIR